MSERQFCDRCEVSLDLHDLIDEADEPSEDDCRHAAAKADLMDRFFGAFF